MGEPCNAIFSAAALAAYRRLFTFLWRLKRVEHSLTAVWRKHCTASRLLSTLHRDPTMHGCYVLRNEMVHFVYNLQYYLMFEVIECASLELHKQLEAATDLDGLLAAHGHYLSSITQKAMLSAEDEAMHRALVALFDSILAFARVQDQLYMSLLEQKAAAREHAAIIAASERAGAFASRGDLTAAQLGEVVVESRFEEQLQLAAAEYRRRIHTFLRAVTKHSSYDLAFLSYRLDFNGHYESQQQPGAALEPAEAEP